MIRVVIADDQRLVRESVRGILERAHGISVVGEADEGAVALRLARELRPDVVLLDVLLRGMGGLEATGRIARLEPAPRIIALTAAVKPPIPAQMLKAGALGYLSKNVSISELEMAVKRVYMGQRYVCNEVAQALASFAFDGSSESPFGILSNREMQIMLMVVNCQKVAEISGNLHLSPKTVNSYRYRIFDKLKVSSDVELALLAVEHGMVARGAARRLGPLRASVA